MTDLDPDLAAGFAGYSGYHTTPDAGRRLFRLARHAGCPIARSEQLGGFHILMDYAEVRRAHQQWEIFSHEPSVMRPLVDRPGFPPLEYDPPRHTPWRELISTLFNGATANRIRDGVRDDVNELIDRVAPAGSCDLVQAFAEEVPMLVLSRVLGLEGEKHLEVRERTLNVMRAAEDPERGQAAFLDFAEFGVREVEARRHDPRNDGLTTIAQWRMGGERPMTPLEIGQAMNSVLIAGHGTSISGISAMFYEVLSRPGLREKLRADESLIPIAIEEALRLHPPFFGLYRRTTEATTVAGVQVPAQDSVMLCWAAANRDPREFDDPDEFRLDRPKLRNRHLTFGLGIHACPGQLVVRTEMAILLAEVLRRLPDLELVDPESVSWDFGGGEMAGITSLPARFTPVRR